VKHFTVNLPRRTGRNQAFSLIEVVLAIGVTSFALLGMVALLPMGLKTSHQAADTMTQAQIVQYARNQMELTPFANLSTAWSGAILYFDNQGLPTTAADPEQIYKVTFALKNVNINGADVLLGGANAPSGMTDAQSVQVIIANRTMAATPPTTNVIVVPNAGF
jgi:uncharacterized protein (TIGR02598 family)